MPKNAVEMAGESEEPMEHDGNAPPRPSDDLPGELWTTLLTTKKSGTKVHMYIVYM